MQRSNIFEHYRTLDEYKTQCEKNKTSYFLENHESSTQIINTRTDKTINAVLVFTDRDGADEIYLFVHKTADFAVCDYFTWQTTTFFAYEQVNIVKDVDYIKFKVLECNVLINDSFWGYFKSSLATAKDTTLSNKAEKSNVISLLIAPKNEMLKIGGSIYFNNQHWDIEDGDIFTINNIGYYYLTRGLNSRDEEEWEPDETSIQNLKYVGEIITLPTELGYIKVYREEGGERVATIIKMESRSINSVSFTLLEAGNIIVETLEQGNSIETVYTVKENV